MNDTPSTGEDTNHSSSPPSPEEVIRYANREAGALMHNLGIEFLEVGASRVVARIPVEGNTQPYGLLHGGATAALCETIGSFGAAMAAGPESYPVGIEINVNHLRAVRQGHVTATGVPIHAGRSTAVWDMKVHDDEGRLVAVGRLTLALQRSQPAGPDSKMRPIRGGTSEPNPGLPKRSGSS